MSKGRASPLDLESYEVVAANLAHARTITDLLYILSLEQQSGEGVCLRDETRIEALALIDGYLSEANQALRKPTGNQSAGVNHG